MFVRLNFHTPYHTINITYFYKNTNNNSTIHIDSGYTFSGVIYLKNGESEADGDADSYGTRDGDNFEILLMILGLN